ncbi:MAG: hypothetical protein HFG37_01560 [Eubacterium sp.]|nr:hypothetical protein [Eubacterium sp.]
MKADLTRDGIPESILIDERAAAEPMTGDEPTIQVFSGKTGEMIWSLPVNTVHGGWNNVYLYRDGGKSFLMTWKPAMYQGAADYEWKVFSLTEEGKEKILASDFFEFDLNYPKKSDPVRLQIFTKRLNEYLKKAQLIISTQEGMLRIGGQGTNGEGEYYDPSKELLEMQRV